jgi:hypothetical protein
MARPADFRSLPPFSALIYACWQEEPRHRPTAATLLKELKLLEAALLPKQAGVDGKGGRKG